MTSRREAIGLLAGAGCTVATGGLLSAPAKGAQTDGGWTDLLNGSDLAGWTFFQDGVGANDRDGVIAFDDGVMHVLGPAYTGPAAPGMGYIATATEYGDYHLSLEYRWGTRRYEPRTLAKRDSGILYHVPSGRDFLWPDCVEYQIMERSTGDAIPVNHRAIPAISAGGIPSWPTDFPGNTRYAPQIDAGGNLRQWIKADGSFDTLDGWNTVELICRGDSAAHIVNGRLVTALYGLQRQKGGDSSTYVPITRGRILLQIEGAEISFRNVRIRAV
ncbi:DUF1080 domain-containing protein [Croceicoccus sp. YJ47]|uniref:3-keto-disaccharide hydrolase n=1 Tax=Croceicoccus sp. YJ47 TaxID=2798724 RepID=UPI0019210403|nr:DUF1080 domain-containing protein [Croceicoccus sp. YJ47]QQN74338.1 DUF1080 domain-containing protein [Croceicoccus sp. YJ47]